MGLGLMSTSWKTTSLFLARISPALGLGTIVAIAVLGYLRRYRQQQKAREILEKNTQSDLIEPISLHPEIDPLKCAGCGACVRACPEGEILQLIDHKAVMVSPTKCVGHGECEVACPFSAITLVFGTKTRGKELPRVTTNYETNVPGLYIAGELGGMGLIRNAIKQGKLATEHAIRNLSNVKGKAKVDILVVGAGAAGLSASLAAIAGGRSYACIEQGSMGGTISNFPRQKVVMTHPAVLPIVGTMKFPNHKVTKETLLQYWNQIRKQTGLKVRNGCKFLNLKKNSEQVFEVETTKGEITAKKVILAMGVRGTPRRLGLPNEELSKVTYNLVEPDQYQRMHVAVVGGGNAAVEAAQFLGNPRYQNTVSLLVRGAKFDRCNQENQDIITEMAKQGQVRIYFNTEVKEIHKKTIAIEKNGVMKSIPNEFLFVFIGAEMPFQFLQELGVKIEKKFGERRKES